MIKAKQVFFWTSDLKVHGFHHDEATIFYLTSNYQSLCCLQNFIFLKSVQCIKSYGHLTVWCRERWIQFFSTEKTP